MSDPVKLRKYVATVEETHHDGGPVLVRPVTAASLPTLTLAGTLPTSSR